jgi:hypothetical protein
MGYRYKSKTYRLLFEGDFEGLEIVCRSGTVQQFVSISQMDTEDAGANKLKDMNNFNKLCAAFSASLYSWNVEDEVTGKPVPTTLEGLFSQDVHLVLSIVEAWMDAVMAQGIAKVSKEFEAGLPMEDID